MMNLNNIIEAHVNFETASPEEKLRIKTWDSIADQQRGKPENIMLKYQHNISGGVMFVLVEHTGDLIHRMTEKSKYGYTGKGPVLEKCKRILNYLRNDYGFKREHLENLEHNAKYYKKDPLKFKELAEKLLTEYAISHSQIPVYNRVQWLARQASVNLGYGNYGLVEKYVAELYKMAKSDNWDDYTKEANFKNGKILQYSKRK